MMKKIVLRLVYGSLFAIPLMMVTFALARASSPAQESEPADEGQDCLLCLNHLLYRTNARLVITSSWRHKIHNGLPLPAFSWVLRSHGLETNVHDVTPPGPDGPEDRRNQIAAWLQAHDNPPYLALDDFPLLPLRSIRTNPSTGLRPHDVSAALKLLEP